MALDDDVRAQLVELSARIAALEAAVEVLRRPATGPATGSTAVTAAKSETAPPPRPSHRASLESRIGAQLLNRIGIVAVLIGMAWFLKLAFDRNWIGPGIRVWIGLACAAGLMVWSERCRRRGFPAFSYSLKALAISIAYLSLWAASSLFHLAPTGLIFLAMTAVTLVNGVLARRQESEVLALYALAGGLATPSLLSTGHGKEVFLFSYLALLNLGALSLLALHPWKRLAWAALLGTAVYYAGWTLNDDSPARFPIRLLFLGLFFAGFAAASFLTLRGGRPLRFFPVAFPLANGAATWVALMLLFAAKEDHSGRPWVTLALAVACLLIAALGPSALSRTYLSRSYLGLGIFFVTVAVPLEFHSFRVTLCWLGESLVLLILAKAAADVAMRVFASAVLALAALSLVHDWIAATPQPLAVVANMYFATSVAGAAVFAAVVWLSLEELRSRAEVRTGIGSWSFLAAFGSVAFSLTVLVAISLEIHHYWFCGAGFFADFCRGYGGREHRDLAADFSHSAWYMLYGAALMAVGFARRSPFLRWQALILLAFSIGRVFLSGIRQQSQGYRVLSFLALGALLLAISFAYQKDWLGLRG